jgi:hypothetical protein
MSDENPGLVLLILLGLAFLALRRSTLAFSLVPLRWTLRRDSRTVAPELHPPTFLLVVFRWAFTGRKLPAFGALLCVASLVRGGVRWYQTLGRIDETHTVDVVQERLLRLELGIDDRAVALEGQARLLGNRAGRSAQVAHQAIQELLPRRAEPGSPARPFAIPYA